MSNCLAILSLQGLKMKFCIVVINQCVIPQTLRVVDRYIGMNTPSPCTLALMGVFGE